MITFFQPNLPPYRMFFFSALHERLGDEMVVYSPVANRGDGVTITAKPLWWCELPAPKMIKALRVWVQPGQNSAAMAAGDIVVISGSIRNLSNFVTILRAKRTGASVVWWGQLRKLRDSRLHYHVLGWVLRNVSAAASYTSLEQESANAVFGRKIADKILSLNNTIDTERVGRLRRPFVAEQRGRRILFLGRANQKAQLDHLVSALAETDGVFLDVIAGGSELERVKSMAAEKGLHERVLFHGPMYSEAQIADVANNCRLFVYPGDVGLSLVHAGAYGLPSVVHREISSHMPEIALFQEEVTGRSFERGNAQSLRATILDLIDDTSSLNCMSQSLLRRIEGEWSREHMVRSMMELLSDLRNKNLGPSKSGPLCS